MFNLNDNNASGPDLGNLRTVRGMLPSLAKGLVEKKAVGKGMKIKPMIQPMKPTMVCECCSLLFAFQRDFDGQLQSSLCSKCEKMLSQGYTCFVSADRYAFGKSPRLADMAGKIVQITDKTMTEMAKQFEVKNKDSGNDKPA